MVRLFSVMALACASVLSFVSGFVDRVLNVAVSMLPSMIGTKPMFVLNNGHPRSPLASLRAGLA